MMPGYVYECYFTANDATVTFDKTAALCKEDGGKILFLNFPKGVIEAGDEELMEVHWLDKGHISMTMYSLDPCADVRFRERCIRELILRNDEVKDYRRRLWGQLRRRG